MKKHKATCGLQRNPAGCATASPVSNIPNLQKYRPFVNGLYDKISLFRLLEITSKIKKPPQLEAAAISLVF